jgi:hypothetical protein
MGLRRKMKGEGREGQHVGLPFNDARNTAGAGCMSIHGNRIDGPESQKDGKPDYGASPRKERPAHQEQFRSRDGRSWESGEGAPGGPSGHRWQRVSGKAAAAENGINHLLRSEAVVFTAREPVIGDTL